MLPSVPWAGSGFRMEFFRREGTAGRLRERLVSARRGRRLLGALGRYALSELAIPELFVSVPAYLPLGDPFNVGQMYALFDEAMRTGQRWLSTFDTAVDLHLCVDTI